MSKEKIDAAIKKITKEANGQNNIRKYQIFSELLIEACTTEEIAGKLLDKDKTIRGADKKISDAARPNGGFIEDEEAHRILFEYFGITPAPTPEVTDYSDLLL